MVWGMKWPTFGGPDFLPDLVVLPLHHLAETDSMCSPIPLSIMWANMCFFLSLGKNKWGLSVTSTTTVSVLLLRDQRLSSELPAVTP